MITVRITVIQDNRASCQHRYTIIATVPAMVRIPETSELKDCEMVLDMFSTSFVIRLMISPCGCVSRYFTGRFTILSNIGKRQKSRPRRAAFTPCINGSSLILFSAELFQKFLHALLQRPVAAERKEEVDLQLQPCAPLGNALFQLFVIGS